VNVPWDILSYQNFWNGLSEREQANFDRAKSHCIQSLNSKMLDAAMKYNASMLLLVRLPNGTQHTKFVLASGEGIEYSKGSDGELIKDLWDLHWEKIQSKII